MDIRSFLAVALALVASFPVAAGAQDPPAGEQLITMRLEGSLTVDPDGSVQEYRVGSKTPSSVKELLDRSIARWRFEPVLVDGKAVAAQSPMRVVVAATKAGADYRLRIDNVLFRANTKEEYAREAAEQAAGNVVVAASHIRPPGYPDKMEKAGLEAIVLLQVRMEPDGRVAEAFVKQSSLLNVNDRPGNLQRALAAFERSALHAAQSWRFDLEIKDSSKVTPGALTVSIPVEYMFRNREIAGTWRREFRGPRRNAPWLATADEEAIGVSDLASGEMLTGTPTLRLRNRDEAFGAP